MGRSNLIPGLLLTALLAGCDKNDQAAQQLVEADARARQELISLQRDLQAEQARVGQQRDSLETERRELANQRHHDPIIVAVLTDLGLVLACLIPVLVCLSALNAADDQNADDQELAEFLTQELVAEQPRLLPPPHDARRIGHGGGETSGDRHESDLEQDHLCE